MLRLTARDGNISLVQRQGHRSRHVVLCLLDKCVQSVAQRREPQTKVNQFGILQSDMLLEVCDVAHFKQHIGLKYAELVYFGLWFTPLRDALDAFVEKTQDYMTGSVTLSLYKGNVSIASRQSEHSLYRTDLSSFTMGAEYDQKDAEGFIRILGLPSRSRARSRVEVAQ